jgi:hypothetical protein
MGMVSHVSTGARLDEEAGLRVNTDMVPHVSSEDCPSRGEVWELPWPVRPHDSVHRSPPHWESVR